MSISYVFSCLVFCSTAFSSGLKVGDPAPVFSLPYATRDSIASRPYDLQASLGHDLILLAFYPANWSGGCTKEMCTFRDSFTMLGDLGVTVLGISGDYVYSHREWAKHLDLPFALLSDHDHEVAKAYESYNSSSGFNSRGVFVIDRSGSIAYIDKNYRAHSTESFDRLKDALLQMQSSK